MSTYDISSIIDPNVFKDFKKLQEESVKYNDTLAKIHKSTVALSDGLKKTEKSEKKLYAAQKESNASLKQLEAAIKKKTIAEKEAGKQIIKLRTETQKLNKDTKRDIILREAEKGSYNQLEAQLSKNIQKLKAMSAAERDGTKAGKNLTKTVYKEQKALKKLSGTMNQHQQNVGNYAGSMLGLAKNLMGALGVVGGLYAFVTATKKAIKVSIDFEKSLSSLQALTGLEAESMAYLGNKALEYTRKYTSSITEIVKAFELVGSKRPELLKSKEALAEVTEQALILSEATGGQLGVEESILSLVGTMNQFNIASSNAAKVVDVLVAAQTYGSATVSQLAETFKNFGTVAQDSNMTVQQGAALAEILASKMIDESEAGTKLTASLINLKKAGVGYVSGQFDIQDALTEVRKSLDESTSAYDRDQKMIKLFGKRNITVGTILLNNIENFAELTKKVDENGIAVEKQKVQMDNTATSLELLGNSWEELTLSITGSTGVLKYFVDGLTQLLNTVTDLFKKTETEEEKLARQRNERMQKDFEFIIQGAKNYEEQLAKIKFATNHALDYSEAFKMSATQWGEFQTFLEGKETEITAKLKEEVAKRKAAEEKAANKNKENVKEVTTSTKQAYTEITEAKWKEVEEILYADETLFIAKRDGMAKLNELQQEYSDQEKARIRERYNLTQALFSSAMELGSVYTTLRVAQLKKEGASEEEVAKIKKDGLIFEKSMAAAQAWVSYFAAIPSINNAAAKMDAAAPGTGVAYQIAEHALQLTAAIAATAQIAAVAIPEFDKGTNFAPDLFIAGEKRPEFMNFGGKTQLIEKPTLFSGFKGAEIISSEDTAKIINNRGYDSPELMNELKGLRSDIRNKTEYYFNFKKGTISSRKGSRYTNYINRLI